MTKKIVIHTDYGAFDLPEEAIEYIGNRKGWEVQGRGVWKRPDNFLLDWDAIPRNDPDLIAFLENAGSNNQTTERYNLVVVEIPDDVVWVINHCEGKEWVAEQHRVWEGPE